MHSSTYATWDGCKIFLSSIASLLCNRRWCSANSMNRSLSCFAVVYSSDPGQTTFKAWPVLLCCQFSCAKKKKKWNSTIKELIPTQKLELFGGEAHTSYWGAPVIMMVQDLSSYQTWMENWSLILILANDYHKQPANIKDETCQNIHFLAYIQGGKCCPYDHATSRTQGGRKIFTYQSICDILYMYLNHLA